MNLQPLFETQKKLDERIVKEKGLEGVALLYKKILALQVELGELANEWRGFKFWSENQEPNVLSYKCSVCGFTSKENIDCPLADEHYEFCMIGFNPLLEEYVDCLHFILSIGNDKNYNIYTYKPYDATPKGVISCFKMLFNATVDIQHVNTINNYNFLMMSFLRLGEVLGFTWEQIEQAYYDKNKVNHERQANGY